jgi:CO dehydrogenase maturation factor
MRETVDATAKDWEKFGRQMVKFHVKNALAWGNARAGEDLTAQVDPDFRIGLDRLRAPVE